jgi:hypothetical protein
MKKVIDTKAYSTKQAKNMTYNLREKFNVYCSIGIGTSFDAHTGTKNVKMRKQYTIYHEYHGHIYCKSWQELQQQYHKVMEKEVI